MRITKIASIAAAASFGVSTTLAGQTLIPQASFIGQASPSGEEAVYGIEFASGRVVAAISHTIRLLGPTASGWALLPAISSSPSTEIVGFATSIRSDGESVVVGSDSGHVLIYDGRSDFTTPLAQWRNPSGTRAVVLAVSGTGILVGTPSSNGSSGGGYLLRIQGTALVEEANFGGPAIPGAIGWSGGWSGDEIVLSGEASAGNWHARAWRRSEGRWIDLGALVPQGAQGNPIFGCSSAVEGGVIAIGARDEATAGWQSGACFIFERTEVGWEQTAKITLNAPPFNNQEMGGSVTVHDGRVWVSASGNMENGTGDRGRLLVIGRQRGIWEIQQVLRASDTGFPTFWGYSPRFGPNGAVATFGVDSPVPFAEWRLRFDVLAPFADCNGDSESDLKGTLNGYVSDLNRDGTPDECQCLGDLNGDGATSGGDLGRILIAWGSTGYGIPEDVNLDGAVDGEDLLPILGAWGPCPN